MCKKCKAGQCTDRPSNSEPIDLICPHCNGDGCERCTYGRFEIATCPKEYVGRDTMDVLLYADLYAKGCPPVSGGALDQSNWFIQACRFVWSEESMWKAKLGLP